jgi:hypothetical protein
MEYTTRLTNIHDLRTGRDFPARSLVYSVRSPWRRGVSLGWNALLARALGSASLFRLAIHPPDLEHPAVWRQIMRIARSIGAARTPTTYRDWIASQRLVAGDDG